MSDMHEHRTTVVEERDSSSAVVIAIVAVVVGGLLIWAIFFSGWIVNRGQPERQTNIEQREGDTNINLPGGGTQPSTQPSPATSP